MSAWEDVIRTSLVQRITDDAAYCQRRLGRLPDEQEVLAAIESSKILPPAVAELAEALDVYESSLWDTLDNGEGEA